MGNILFIFELIMAQALLLYACPKRDKFAIRLAICIPCCFLLGYFFPNAREKPVTQMYYLLKYFVFLTYTIVAAVVCFKMPWHTSASLCVAGYAIQHISYQATILLSKVSFLKFLNVQLFGVVMVLEILVFALLYAAAWLLFGRRIAKKEYYKNSDWRFDVLAVVVVFICIILTRVSYMLSGFNSLSPRIYAIVCCVLALVIQFNFYDMLSEKYEKETICQLWREERKQYALSKQMVDTINVKCHDLKYKLREHGGKLSEEERKSIVDAIDIYDGMVKTGNEVLDVILAENHLQCKANNIKFTFMGDGQVLSFMSASDIYSLFGNALDNAREAVTDVEEDRRIVNLTVTKKGDFVNVDLVNYFSGELIYEDGVIATRKTEEKGYHGFGMKSMQMLAQKYGGDLRVSVNGDLFSLGIYLFGGNKEE